MIFHIVADQGSMNLPEAEKLVIEAVRLLNEGDVVDDVISPGDSSPVVEGGGLDVLFLNHAVSTLGFWVGSDVNVTSAKLAINVNYLSFVSLFSAALPVLKQRSVDRMWDMIPFGSGNCPLQH